MRGQHTKRRAAVLAVLVPTVCLACSKSTSTPASPSDIPASSGPVATLVDATVIDTNGGTVGTTQNFIGQSVTLPGGGPYNNIRFNWYTPSMTPTAFGVLYVLDREFVDSPGQLSPTTAGFVARSERISENQYLFPAAATLNGGTRYWFYTDTKISSPAVLTSFNNSTYADGDLYIALMATTNFRKLPASPFWTPSGFVLPPPNTFTDANFRLQGTAAR